MGTEIQQNRYDQLLRRAGGLIGPGAKVAEVLAELFPVFDVENMPGELLILGGTRVAFGGASLQGAAAEGARIGLRNPLDSGNLVTISSVVISTTTTQTIRFGVNNTVLTTGVGTETFRDLRLAVTQRPIAEVRTQSSVALSPATGQLRLTAHTPVTLEDANGVAVLPPGFGFEVGTGTDATLIFVTYFWRERVAEISELNL